MALITSPDPCYSPLFCVLQPLDLPLVSHIASALFLPYITAFHTFHIMPSASTPCLVDSCHLELTFQNLVSLLCVSFSFILICVILLLSIFPTIRPVGQMRAGDT